MTNQHPLTDEICKGLVIFPLESEHDYIEMRAAYDLGRDEQLEQVIEYLEKDLEFVLWSDSFMKKFKLAMRPQEEN